MIRRVLLLSAFICYTSAASIPRDDNGRIKRSSATRKEFMKTTGYPSGRPGYVIDHVYPLKRGGCDDVKNMQWQTIEESKEKDRWE